MCSNAFKFFALSFLNLNDRFQKCFTFFFLHNFVVVINLILANILIFKEKQTIGQYFSNVDLDFDMDDPVKLDKMLSSPNLPFSHSVNPGKYFRDLKKKIYSVYVIHVQFSLHFLVAKLLYKSIKVKVRPSVRLATKFMGKCDTLGP